ncbi:MAG: hypothetical protein WCX17_04090 [Parcubacteria group bacterium]|jgi:hypothetical protein
MADAEKSKPWKLEGYDTFSNEPYPIPGDYPTEIDVIKAALEKMEELRKNQPSKTSGGQGTFGIQDRIYIVRPNGDKYRYIG